MTTNTGKNVVRQRRNPKGKTNKIPTERKSKKEPNNSKQRKRTKAHVKEIMFALQWLIGDGACLGRNPKDVLLDQKYNFNAQQNSNPTKSRQKEIE